MATKKATTKKAAPKKKVVAKKAAKPKAETPVISADPADILEVPVKLVGGEFDTAQGRLTKFVEFHSETGEPKTALFYSYLTPNTGVIVEMKHVVRQHDGIER